MEITTNKERSELMAMCAARHINLWVMQNRYATKEATELLNAARFIQSISPNEAILFRAVIRPEGSFLMNDKVLSKRFECLLSLVQQDLNKISHVMYWRDYVNAINWKRSF